MKIYLSYPMTRAGCDDGPLIQKAREALTGLGVSFYDPALDEPPDAEIDQLQEYDFAQMSTCSLLFVVWSPGARISRGVNAEIEWAARVFNLPIYTWYAAPMYPLEPWTRATLSLHPLSAINSHLEDLVWSAHRMEESQSSMIVRRSHLGSCPGCPSQKSEKCCSSAPASTPRTIGARASNGRARTRRSSVTSRRGRKAKTSTRKPV